MCHLWGDLFPENYRSNCIKRKPNNLVVWTPALVNTKFGNLGTCKLHDAYTTFLWVLPTFPNSEVLLPQKFHLSFSEVSLLESLKKIIFIFFQPIRHDCDLPSRLGTIMPTLIYHAEYSPQPWDYYRAFYTVRNFQWFQRVTYSLLTGEWTLAEERGFTIALEKKKKKKQKNKTRQKLTKTLLHLSL